MINKLLCQKCLPSGLIFVVQNGRSNGLAPFGEIHCEQCEETICGGYLYHRVGEFDSRNEPFDMERD